LRYHRDLGIAENEILAIFAALFAKNVRKQ